MPLVSLTGVTVSFGERKLFEGVNLTVAQGSRMALVGPNGSGKTTLMRIMASLASPDTGSMVREKDTRVSYVPQSGVVHTGATLREEAEKAFAYGKGLVEEITALEERMGALSPTSPNADALLWKHHALQEKLEASRYYAREEAAYRVLTGLGFSREDFQRPCAEFSAGWQMRIALARAILEAPDILLLDEPTNYLDIEARTWMEEFLADFTGGLLLVSHDRYFLDVVVSAVAEIYMTRVSVFSGNYSRYEEVRSKELVAIMERWRAQQEEIAHAEAFIAKFRYNASKARLVQSRITALEKVERIEVPPIVKTIHFKFPRPRLQAGWSFRPRVLPSHTASTRSSRGGRGGLPRGQARGRRGQRRRQVHAAAYDLAPREARRGGAEVGHRGGSRLLLAGECRCLDQQPAGHRGAGVGRPTPLIPELRTMLGAFLFRGDDVFKSVSVLSGGEKSRLALLMLLLKPANLLILDEPTNHLDLSSKEVLLGR